MYTKTCSVMAWCYEFHQLYSMGEKDVKCLLSYKMWTLLRDNSGIMQTWCTRYIGLDPADCHSVEGARIFTTFPSSPFWPMERWFPGPVGPVWINSHGGGGCNKEEEQGEWPPPPLLHMQLCWQIAGAKPFCLALRNFTQKGTQLLLPGFPIMFPIFCLLKIFLLVASSFFVQSFPFQFCLDSSSSNNSGLLFGALRAGEGIQ